MYIALDQLKGSLRGLRTLHPFFGMSFLAFKRTELPVGTTATVNFSQVADDILSRHYRPSKRYAGFYNPFYTSTPNKRWLKPRYGSTSLQRITADTFRDALLHPKNSSHWGWRDDYVKRLRSHLPHKTRIPAFHLAVWLFRELDWGRRPTGERVRNKLFATYNINDDERGRLFDDSIPPLAEAPWSEQAVTEDQLLDAVGWPPGVQPSEGAAVRFLRLVNIGPAKRFAYQPADRLNIVTGDNSLGKTFLFECMWWALSGTWFDLPAYPRPSSPRRSGIEFGLGATGRHTQRILAKCDPRGLLWRTSPKTHAPAGLVVYARYDGSFAIWDPAKAGVRDAAVDASEGIRLAPIDVWRGKDALDRRGQEMSVCNGLLRDWVTWQTGGDRYLSRYNAFVASLSVLSPPGDIALAPGEPTRLGFDTREVPTLEMPFGPVPIKLASAGIQRILALAYVIVWSWVEHAETARLLDQEPECCFVLIVDEVEAHLHPQWQRVIVPAILRVVQQQSADLKPQLHIATHSPLVLASVEQYFDHDRDAIHHLRLEGTDVLLETVPFVKRGGADKWLTSEVFGLGHARSIEAETLIGKARALQSQRHPDSKAISKLHSELLNTLAVDDEFWPTWCFFAQQRGAAP